MTIIYCYDAYCNWCFGFSIILKKLSESFNQNFDIEVLSSGMILPNNPVHISVTASYLLKTYKEVEAVSGITFGEDYLWHIKNPMDSDWYPNSEKPAIALCVFKEYFPDKQVEFAIDLEYALLKEGRDLCDDEAYRHLLSKYHIHEEDFYEKLHSKHYKDRAYDEFDLVKQLKVTGYPCLLMQITDSKFNVLANGYTDYDTIVSRISSITKEKNLSE